MTQEEKARAYDEALKRAKKQRADYQKELNKADKKSKLAYLLRAGICAIDMAFPELKKSEDERIKNEILVYIGAKKDIDLETHNRWCSYLEKQKEQEHICDSTQYEEGFKTGLEIGLRKQKEQKPAERSEENYDKISQQVYKAIRKTLASLAVYAENEALLDSKEETLSYYSQQCAEKILKSLRPSWKPSEEQMKALQNAVALTACDKELVRLYNQLQKL